MGIALPTCKFVFLILYLHFKNLSSTASAQLQEKDIQHFLLTQNFQEAEFDLPNLGKVFTV